MTAAITPSRLNSARQAMTPAIVRGIGLDEEAPRDLAHGCSARFRAGDGPGTGIPIAAMRSDHDDCVRQIAEIRSLTGDLIVPQGACTARMALYEGLAEFIEDLTEHMRLENDVLFPQFETEVHTDD